VAAYAALGRQSEAVAAYRRLVTLAPDNHTSSHALAAALIAANQSEEGENVVRQTLSRTRPTAALHHTHARSLIALERFDQAELALRESLRLEPRRADAQDSLAQLVWMRTGDIGEATEVLDQALERYRHEDALWATKAALLQGAGDARGAYACLAEHAARDQTPPALLIRTGLAALEFEPAIALALAQNRNNGLRCIFHGWKFDVDGHCVDAPTEPLDRREAFAARVPVRSHPSGETAAAVASVSASISGLPFSRWSNAAMSSA